MRMVQPSLLPKWETEIKSMATTYHVSASNGNNNNAGTDAGQPLRTIQAAINKAQAGDTITVRGGTYAERLYIQKPGTTDAPIVLGAAEGEQPVIDGETLAIPEDAALVVVQQSQDISLVGLTLRNAGGRGLLISKSSRVTVRNCAVETCYAGGLQASQCDTLLIEKCVVRDCGRRFLAHGPSRRNVALLVASSKDVTIQENRVFENSDEGVGVMTGCERVTVRKNTCYDNRNGQIGVVSSVEVTVEGNLCYHTGRSAFLTLRGQRGPGIRKRDTRQYRDGGRYHTRDLNIRNNIVIGCGVGFETERDGGPMNGLVLAHNTIVNSTEAGIHIGLREMSRRSFVENNLIASANGGGMARVVSGQGIVWRHNLWTAFPGEVVYNPASDVVEAESGLVNIAAPLAPGEVTADPYKLVGVAAAINRGIRRGDGELYDFWGTPRDGQPDLGANEYPGGASDPPEGNPSLPPAGARVSNGLQALYDFKEGQGRAVRDVSGVGEALNLRIKDESRVVWSNRGLEVKQNTIISSESPARKLIRACRESNEITIEAWIVPLSVHQDGPARIVSISGSKTERNMTLGQGLYGNRPMNLYMARLRTTQTSANGLPAVVTPSGSATRSLTHVVYTRRPNGLATLYVNGQDRGVLNVGGALSNWDERMPLLLANELSEDRPWLGLFRLVAIYSRALTAAEVLHNYEVGLEQAPVSAAFVIAPGDARGVAPHTVEFDSSESAAAAGIASYFWEFGNGETSTQASPAHTYTTPGVYTVSLTVTDTQGRTDKVTKANFITVVGSPVAPLPADYARFILIQVRDSTVVAFGVQYPDLRCALMWNQDPYHMMVYSEVEDVRQAHASDEGVELIWVDPLEETE